MTLYRHTSGAWVFGAGTVQWTWGLDGTHDRGGSIPDVAMQQATVNLFSGMRSQPKTLQPGLVPGDGSSDSTPPDVDDHGARQRSDRVRRHRPVTATATDNVGVVGVQF